METNKKGLLKAIIVLIVIIIVVTIALVCVIKNKNSDSVDVLNQEINQNDENIETEYEDPFLSMVAFSNFSIDVDTVNIACMQAAQDALSNAVASGMAISEAQAYNLVAKGSITEDEGGVSYDVLTRFQAAAIPCTRIEKEKANQILDIDLPELKVNTPNNKNIEASFFITNEGDVFVWPPFLYDGKFYLNVNREVKTPDGIIIDKENESIMYEDGFEFVIDNVTIKISNELDSGIEAINDEVSIETLNGMPGIYYKDVKGAESPKGIESK